jgi:hypothetical protein
METTRPIGYIALRMPDGSTKAVPVERAEAYQRLFREGHILEALAAIDWPTVGDHR